MSDQNQSGDPNVPGNPQLNASGQNNGLIQVPQNENVQQQVQAPGQVPEAPGQVPVQQNNLLASGQPAPAQGNQNPQGVAAGAPQVQQPIPNAPKKDTKYAEVYPLSDRYQAEKGILAPPKVGGGLFGFSQVDLGQLKKEKLTDVPDTYQFRSNDEILKKIENDGLYVNDPEVQSKYKDINVQKLEERLLKNNLTKFFKANGDLKLDNDLLADEITRPADMAFEKTMAFQTKETNAILQDRHHSYKKRYYRLDVIVGKIKISRCKNILNEEDNLSNDLIEQYKEYEKRTSLAMIPFYQQRLQFIEDELHDKRGVGGKKSERQFLEFTRKEVSQRLVTEQTQIQEMTKSMYDKWLKIEEVRKAQNFRGNNTLFQVFKCELDNGKTEFKFNITNDQLQSKKIDGTELDSAELNRRKDAQNQKFYIKLIINGQTVATSQKCSMTWPNYEVVIDEVFQLNTFTMPRSIEIHIMLSGFCDTLIDKQEIEVPGEYVRTLTCTSHLVQAKHFSNFEYNKRTQKQKPLVNPEDESDPVKKNKLIEEKKKQDLLIEQQKKVDIAGEIYVKAEWKGNGPQMPPIKSENLFTKAAPPKNRHKYDEKDLASLLYIDVNDPRNEKVIKDLKFLGNEYLMAMMKDDQKNDLHKIEPFRHMLLRHRSKNPLLQNLFIPMLENEIVDSNRTSVFLELLEKIYQEKTFNQYLAKKAQLQKERAQQTLGVDPSQKLERDFETMRRRNEILTKIKNRKKSQQISQQMQQNYKQIVKEYDLPAFENNPLKALFSKLLQAKSRRLKPIVKAPDPASLGRLTEFNINMHVIKAENVPLRHNFIQEFQKNKGGSGQQQFQNQSLNQFNNQPSYNPNQPSNSDKQKELIAQMWQHAKVEPYVEVKMIFDDKKYLIRTTTVDEGQLPKWDQILSFCYKDPEGRPLTQKNLEKSGTRILVSLFDKEIYRHQEEGKIILQEENRFLGSFEIPLLTLLTSTGKIEFNFKINRPFCLPSYRVLAEQFFIISHNDFLLQDEQLRKNEQIPTYINMSVTLDPPICLPDENAQCDYKGYETEELLSHGTKYATDCRINPKLKGRKVSVFGENIDAESVLLCKYLTKVRPPDQLVDVDRPGQFDHHAIEKVARFVSLIPFIEDSRKFEDLTDMYCTPQEFLDIGEGDYEEHAILLCCYFKYIDSKRDDGLKVESYLVFGEAIPEGRTVYVLRKQLNEHSVEIWNPLTGECYFFHLKMPTATCCGFGAKPYLVFRTQDPICPLSKIYNIIGEQNIWSNTQPFDAPIQMRFNFDDKKDWKPLFDDKNREDFGFRGGLIDPCYDPLLKYTLPIPIGQTQILEERVQKYLNDQFEEERIERVRKPTKWAVLHVEFFRTLLTTFESLSKLARRGGTDSILRGQNRNQDEDLKLKNISEKIQNLCHKTQKRIWGFPINVTLTTFENLWEAVKATRMHQVNRQDIEFALAVHISPYNCGVMSIWVYIAAFVDTSTENLTNE